MAVTACSPTDLRLPSTCDDQIQRRLRLISRTPVPFRYQAAGVDLYAERPLIELSCANVVTAVTYNNRAIRPMRLPAAECAAYYGAYRKFAALLRESRLQMATRLNDGDLVVFDNRRVLHGRTGFASARHPRHLQGCYLTRDSVYSVAAVLRQQLDGGDHTMTVADEIFAVYARHGSQAYFGEDVNMSEHGLQAAYFAQNEQAADALVVAALLHDVGHLTESVPANIAEWTRDARHERSGSRWLARHFGPEVSEPVRLHVPAKRYLCATEPAYSEQLSEASVITLKLQGGPMSPAEIAAFEAEPYWRDAVRVRRWDDQGKVAGLKTPGFEHYRPLIERLAHGAGDSATGLGWQARVAV